MGRGFKPYDARKAHLFALHIWNNNCQGYVFTLTQNVILPICFKKMILCIDDLFVIHRLVNGLFDIKASHAVSLCIKIRTCFICELNINIDDI